VLLQVDVIRVLQIADIKVDRRVDVGTGDVNVASGVRVGGPIGHGHVLGVIGEHGVVAIVAVTRKHMKTGMGYGD
jgi:hypothetical protein